MTATMNGTGHETDEVGALDMNDPLAAARAQLLAQQSAVAATVDQLTSRARSADRKRTQAQAAIERAQRDIKDAKAEHDAATVDLRGATADLVRVQNALDALDAAQPRKRREVKGK